MSLCCIYHKKLPFQVMEEEDAALMVTSGQWFYHPNDLKEKEISYEEPIRRKPRERSKHRERSPKTNGSGA